MYINQLKKTKERKLNKANKMIKIQDILKLDINESIKSVIDLEANNQDDIQDEIENYIVTDGLAKYFSKFIEIFTANEKEKGVWISGFYGSGKSYFAKMLAYLLSNDMINGTLARERFIPRLQGVKNQSILENEIRSLDAFKIRVVQLDIAKQPKIGIAKVLFKFFLKSLGFLDDIYGYIEFTLFLEGEYDAFCEKVKTQTGSDWEITRKSVRKGPAVMKRVLLTDNYNEDDFKNTIDKTNQLFNEFSANALKGEIEKYIEKYPDETIVFLFDEASEAIVQKSFSLLDLEGISEAFSSISKSKVWTIAIAQQKLDTVINNNNINTNDIIKVTDRFKTKIHIASTDVDIIIKNRLLSKKEKYYKELVNFYQQNEGLVAETTNLNSNFPTQTSNKNEFATYYPFHKYQFDFLQKFLFASNALVATQIAARGMIITTFDVLKKQLKDDDFLSFCSSDKITREAQTAPEPWLVNKYDTAEKIIKKKSLNISGDKLLKVLHFINNSEHAQANLDNITKLYITDINSFYENKPLIDEALNLLVESKVLLLSNNKYTITSDVESRLLDEMQNFMVEPNIRKITFTSILKKLNLFNFVSTINENSVSYNFNIKSDEGDDIKASSNKHLNLNVYNIYTTKEDRDKVIENIKNTNQNNKEVISLVPQSASFKTIDKLIVEIKRYLYIEERYSASSDNIIRSIVRDFSTIKEEKQGELNNQIKKTYINSSLIYLFDIFELNKENFNTEIAQLQKKLIKNVYTKRLAYQLPESIAPKIISEKQKTNLSKSFANEDFIFFDKEGNFIGDNLSVIEELSVLIKNKHLTGKVIEAELLKPPTGYTYGTVSTSLAVLFRAGKLIAKYNGSDLISYTDSSVKEIFANGRNFQKTEFKILSKSLSESKKREIVKILLDLKINEQVKVNIDYNTNALELIEAIRVFSDNQIIGIEKLKNTVENFETIFTNVSQIVSILQNYNGKTNEANYIDKAENFLKTHQDFSKSIKNIKKIEKFINRNLKKAREYKEFVQNVETVYKKAIISSDQFSSNYKMFNYLYSNELVNNYAKIQELAQNIKDEYFGFMKVENKKMSELYKDLKATAQEVIEDIKTNYPIELNTENIQKTQQFINYTNNRIIENVSLDFNIQCKNSNFTLSEIKDYIALFSNKENELNSIKSSLITAKPIEGKIIQHKIRFKKPNTKMLVKEYKNYLNNLVSEVAQLNDSEELTIEMF